MKKSKFTEEQIAYALRQAESGTPVLDVCRKLGISEQAFHLWKKYEGMGVAVLRRLRHLDDDNRRLKSLVVNLTLDNTCCKWSSEKSSKADSETPVEFLSGGFKVSRRRAMLYGQSESFDSLLSQ